MSAYGLENFIQVTKNDPLFAAEGLDLDNGRYALNELKKSFDAIKRAWKGLLARTFFFKYPPEETACPIRFLENFIESESVRRTFLENPSYEGAKMLLRQWTKTKEAYSEGANSYKEALLALKKIEGMNENAVIHYFDSAVSFSGLIDWIDGLLANSQRVGAEIKELESVLNGLRPPLIKSLAQSLVVEAKNLPRLPPVDSGLQELLKIETSKKHIKKYETFDPIIYWLAHFDEGNVTPRRFIVSFEESNNINCKRMSLLLADDMYFLNLKRGHLLDLSNYEPLIKKGLDYWYQPATYFYTTLDVSYWADIASIVDMKRRYFAYPDLVLRQRSSLLDLLIGTAASISANFSVQIKIFSHYRKLPPLNFFYLVRVHPTLYFLPFNKSVWRIKKDPHLFGTRFTRRLYHESYYDLKKRVPLHVLKDIVETSNNRFPYFKEKLGI
ncbi:hypothetical protein IIA95_03515 [Patescibacteria group bacterium]|nr:hypothetical protein [Patescibacteria group bacterium]